MELFGWGGFLFCRGSYINAGHLIWIIIVPHRKTHFVFLCTVLGRWSALFPPPSKVDRAGRDKIEGSLWFTSTACTSYISQPTDTPEPGNFHRTSGNSSRWSLAGFASKSSLPCPGEEAPPRPKSLVGVGTWGLQVIALGPKRRHWAAVPSAAQGGKALPTSGSGGRDRDQRPEVCKCQLSNVWR